MAVTFNGRDLVVDFKENSANGAERQYRIEYVCASQTITHYVNQADYQSVDVDGMRLYVDTLSFAEILSAGATRDITVRLYTQDADGKWSNPAKIQASNPAPVFPSAPTVNPEVNALRFTTPTVADTDFAGIKVYMSLTSPVTLTQGNLKYEGPNTSVTLDELGNGVHYCKVVPFDVFGDGTPSAEISATPIKSLADFDADANADIQAAIGRLDAADDDGIYTISEKFKIVIPAYNELIERFYSLLTSGASTGLKPATENLLLHSDDLTQWYDWTSYSLTVESNVDANPIDGRLTADRVSGFAQGGVRRISMWNTTSTAVGDVVSASIWLKGESSNIGSDIGVQLGTTVNLESRAHKNVTLTAEWQEVRLWFIRRGGTGVYLTVTEGVNSANSVLVACPAMYRGLAVLPWVENATGAPLTQVSTSPVADAAVTAYDRYLKALEATASPWDDIAQDSQLLPPDNILSNSHDLTLWGKTTDTAVGYRAYDDYYDVSDVGAGDAHGIYHVVPSPLVGVTYTAIWRVKKDDVVAATRVPMLYLYSVGPSGSGVPEKGHGVRLDTTTGEFSRWSVTQTDASYGVIDAGDEWVAWVETALDAGQNALSLYGFPAISRGLTANADGTLTGTATVRRPQLFQGTIADLARRVINARTAAFARALDDFASGIRQVKVAVQWAPTSSGPWDDNYTLGTDFWMRQSVDNRQTWGPSIKTVGEDGNDGTRAWTPTTSARVVADGSTFTCTGVSTGWEEGFYSNEKFKQATISCQPGQTNMAFMFALAANPSADHSYFGMDYALYFQSDGIASIWRYGNPIVTLGSYVATETWTISHSGHRVEFSANGAEIYSFSDASPDTQYGLDVSFGSTGTVVKNVTLSSAGEPGNFKQTVFKRASATPAAPAGNGIPTGWSDDPPVEDGNPLYMSTAEQTSTGVLIGSWSTPVQIEGRAGAGTFTLIKSDSSVKFDGSTLTRDGGAGGWDTGAYSAQKYGGGCALHYRAPATYGLSESWMIGLNSDPEASHHYTDIDFAIYHTHTGAKYEQAVYVNGGRVAQRDWDGSERNYLRYDARTGNVACYTVGNPVPWGVFGIGANKHLGLDFTVSYKASLTELAFFAAGSDGIDGNDGIDGLNGQDGQDGASAFTLLNHQGCTIESPNSFYNMWGGAWNTAVYSKEAFVNGAFVSARTRAAATAQRAMIGLSKNPTANASYETIDYAIYTNFGYLSVYELGAPIGDFGTYVHGVDVLSVQYDAKHVKYAKNGNVFRTVAAPANLVLYLDTSAYDNSSGFQDIAFGPAGPAGTSPISTVSSPTTVNFMCDASGTPKSGQLPKTITNAAYQDDAAVAITSISNLVVTNCTASVSGSSVTITAISAPEGQVKFDIDAAGQARTVTVMFTSTNDGAAEAIFNRSSTSQNITGASFVQHGSIMDLNASPSGKIGVTYNATYRVPAGLGNSFTAEMKVQYRLSPSGAWIDVPGSQVIGTSAQTDAEPPYVTYPGSAGASGLTITGLTASAAYQFRMMSRKYSGNSTTTDSCSATLYAEQKA